MSGRKRTKATDDARVAPGGRKEDEDGDMVFEDPYEDEMEEEEAVMADDDMEVAVEDGEEEDTRPTRVWRPGVDKLQEDEVWDYDASAYDMYHRLNMEWPCLSFDILKDKFGAQRTKFPHTMYFVAGTQANKAHLNKILVCKASELHRTKHDMGDDSDEDDDPDDLDDDPVLEWKYIAHQGTVNRIRSMPQKPEIVASWSDTGSVHLWNVGGHLSALDTPGARVPTAKPLFSFSGHTDEGYAVDWSPVSLGRLATGDCHKFIYVWNARESAWTVDLMPYKGHEASVEDIQWSPSEANVFASCSVDGSIKIWDTRRHEAACLSAKAHETDVNVLSWNPRVGNLLLSGADDGSFRTWDLRVFGGDAKPTADFAWHRAPITSVEWSPVEESVLAVSSDDGQVTLWDLAVEADEEAASGGNGVPQQLLFEHLGQTHPKEIHWHPQIPGVLCSTAEDGFNVFKTINSYHAPKR